MKVYVIGGAYFNSEDIPSVFKENVPYRHPHESLFKAWSFRMIRRNV